MTDEPTSAPLLNYLMNRAMNRVAARWGVPYMAAASDTAGHCGSCYRPNGGQHDSQCEEFGKVEGK